MKFYSNLSGDFICPFQLFIDINRQLDQPVKALEQQVFSPICELETTNDWINLEALGKPAALRAKQFSQYLFNQNNDCFEQKLDLHLRIDDEINSDNLYSILFLAEKATQVTITCYTNNKLKNIETLQGKNNISVNIEKLQQATHADESKWDELLLQRDKLLQQMKMPFHQTWFEEDVAAMMAGALIGFAWMSLKAGSHQSGCNMLSKAMQQLEITPAMQELLFMHLQLTRFLSHQYAVVTAEKFADSFEYLSDEDVNSLCFIKAYAATMSRNIEVADEFFARCGVNEEMELSDEASLYRLNLFALSQVIKGKMPTAFSLEMRIEKYIEEHDIDVVGLKYVNFINIARLYKKSAQYEESLQYYEKAYQQIRGGGYTISDLIYYNMNLGSLHEASGDNHLALLYWLKAAMNWLAFDNKYALAWRPRIILCQEKLIDILNPLSIENASNFLHEKITQLLELTAVDIIQTDKTCAFAYDDYLALDNASCYLSENLIVIDANHRIEKQYLSQAEQRLSSLVAAVLSQRLKLDVADKTLYLPTEYESLYPQSDEMCWLISSLLNCTECFRDGNNIQFSADKQQQLIAQSVAVGLSPSIESIQQQDQGLALKFKRSFLNKTVDNAEEVACIKQLQQSSGHAELKQLPQQTLNRLRAKKVIQQVIADMTK